MDLNEMCRTCLRSGEPMSSLFDLKVTTMESPQIAFRMVTGICIYPDDGLPHQICTDCVQDFQRSYAFKLKCNRSQVILNQLKDVKIRIKKSNDSEIKRENQSSNYEILNYSYPDSTADHELITTLKAEQSPNAKLEHDSNGNDCPARSCSVLQYVKEEPELDISLLDTKSEEIFTDHESYTELPEYSGRRTTRKRSIYLANSKKEKDAALVCKICRKNCRRRDNLIRHLSTHSGNFEIDIDKKCTECFRFFSCEYDLRRHARSHTKENPFRCEKCSKTFRYKGNLNAHVEAIHDYVAATRSKENSGKYTFQCDACSKTFKYKRSLQKHRKIKHNPSRNSASGFKRKRRNKRNKN